MDLNCLSLAHPTMALDLFATDDNEERHRFDVDGGKSEAKNRKHVIMLIRERHLCFVTPIPDPQGAAKIAIKKY